MYVDMAVAFKTGGHMSYEDNKPSMEDTNMYLSSSVSWRKIKLVTYTAKAFY